MRSAVAAIIIGAGVAIASAFASSWGLSVHQQRVAFGFGVLLVLVGVALLVYKRREGGSAMADQGNRSIHTENQSGGTNITGDIHITAPQPSVHVSTEAQDKPTDDGYMTTMRVHLDAPYAARNLVVLVGGTGVKTYGINRVDPSASLSTGGITYRGMPATIVGAPLTSDYRVFITTDGPASGLQVEALLDVDVQ
jgi:hypothetical protein